jgi:hypothetical protein
MEDFSDISNAVMNLHYLQPANYLQTITQLLIKQAGAVKTVNKGKITVTV